MEEEEILDTFVGGEVEDSRVSPPDLFALACWVGLDFGVVVIVTPILPDSLRKVKVDVYIKISILHILSSSLIDLKVLT